ncbi:MAG TPA: hypothetical protein VGB76_16020 [Pyrinomonadaceae bacterium]|jgi:hypothetical protein
MFGRVPESAQLERVFQLCYAVLGDEDAAFAATVNCALALDVEVKEQRARKRYRIDASGFRQKLIMRRELALQFIAFRLCHKEELAQEARWREGLGPMPHESYFVTRYIKHILYMTVPHRSFQVAVALGRLLYDYLKREVYLVHDSLAQDPRLRKNDQMYKDWKLALMNELHEARFKGLLTVKGGKQGAKSFETHGQQEQLVGLVENVLKLLSPWGTACALEAGSRSASPFRNFRFTGHPDKESPFEEKRMRAIIDPDCLTAVTRELKVPPPVERLAVPLFNLPDQPDQIPPVDFNKLPQFTVDRLRKLFDEVTGGRRRRRKARRTELSVEVDGVERTSFDPAEQSEVTFTLERGDDLIQVVASDEDGPLLLGSLLLSSSGALDGEEDWKGVIRLEGGQRVNVTVTPLPASAGAARGANVVVAYSEGDLFGWLRGAAWAVGDRIKSWTAGAQPGAWGLALRYVAVFGVAAVLSVAAWVFYTGKVELAFWRPKTVEQPTAVETPGERKEIVAQVLPSPEDKGHNRPGQSGVVGTNRSPSPTPLPGKDAAPVLPADLGLVVMDGVNTFVLDEQGNVSGINKTLPKSYRAALELTLSKQQISVAPLPSELTEVAGQVMGSPSADVEFTLLSPAGEVVPTTTPVLTWNPLDKAKGYKVEVFDEQFNPVAESPELHTIKWQVPKGKLRHGHAYSWKVTAFKEGGEVSSHRPDDAGGRARRLSQTKFKVMESSAAEMLRSAKGKYNSRLLAAIVYARSSMPEQAEGELQALLRDNPGSAVLQKLLGELRSQRR